MGASPFSRKKRLAAAKCPQPKNPDCAESGLGCGASRTKWREELSEAFFARAFCPHSMKTMGLSLSFSKEMTLSVKISQPLPLCELA